MGNTCGSSVRVEYVRLRVCGSTLTQFGPAGDNEVRNILDAGRHAEISLPAVVVEVHIRPNSNLTDDDDGFAYETLELDGRVVVA